MTTRGRAFGDRAGEPDHAADILGNGGRIGTKFVDEGVSKLEIGDRIAVDDECKTSLANVWAGGDCVVGDLDLTVSAVDDGNRAAAAIHAALTAKAGAKKPA